MSSGPVLFARRSIGAAALVMMTIALISITWAAAGLFAQMQSTEVHIKYNSGQSITPIYEGWERVPDGSFNMVFGYLNRNHVEQISLPVGAQNNFEPGPADRGQPAYFYPRENHFIFRVNIPKDWDKKRELVWSLTVRGKTETARATLLDIWEIDRKLEVANNGGGVQVSNALIAKDEPPSITLDPTTTAKVGTPVPLTAHVSDDGIPPPDMKKREPRPLEPSLKNTGLPSPVNVPMPARPRPPQGGGLSVWWFVYRGPAAVTFEPEGYAKIADGKSVVKAMFTQPGTYVIRAFAHDGLIRTPADLTITVAQ
jgi:hypothetical protein